MSSGGRRRDDDDEDDDRPRRRRDDDEDDRPRRRRRPAAQEDDGGIGTVIPYRNAPALFAYYCAIFGLIPCLGAFLGLAGLILGIIGLQRASRNEQAHGKVHALIGIILGGLEVLANLGGCVGFVILPILNRG